MIVSTKSDVDVSRLAGRVCSRFWHTHGCVSTTQAAVSSEEAGLDPDLECLLVSLALSEERFSQQASML